jgi:Ca-activated chloride channel homolog
MQRNRAPVFFLIGFLAVSIALSAKSQDELRVDVRLVNIVATVTDGRGRYVPGLTAEDFIVEEDSVRQKIAHFSQDQNIPVSVGIVLDTSGSMDRKIQTAVDAVDRFIRTIHADDDIFLMTFSNEPILRQDFTNDRNKLSKALKSVRVTGGTAMYDALNEALIKMHSGAHEKRAILLISDGADTSSRLKFGQALQAVRESELLIYCLGIASDTYAGRNEHVPFTWPLPRVLGGKRPVTSRRDAVDMDILDGFADNSGGRAVLLSDSWVGRGNEIDKVLTQVADELRSQYTLGYYPTAADDGQFHSVRVRTKTGLPVRSRTGYQSEK